MTTSRPRTATGGSARAAIAIAIALVLGACAVSPATGRARTEPPSAARQRLTIAAAGDIVCDGEPGDGSVCRYDDTADLVIDGGFARILLLGDTQYETGALAAYRSWFDDTWGRAFERLAPAPGNHEYAQDATSRPRGYFRYFGRAVKGPDGLGYYSFDLGACPDAPCWHVIALSSQLCFAPGGCDAPDDPSSPGRGERMYRWLRADLAAHPNDEYPCTLAFWHHPLFSFSTGSGATGTVRPLWELLHAARADVVLNGHSHNYQRWRPLDPDGALDRAHGIREFVVGTGGRSLYALPSSPWPHNLAAAQARAFGVLSLTLRPRSYTWRWLGVPGQPAFTDASATAAACA